MELKNMISAVVITKNEEKNIGECLATLSWCDEVIVVDDESLDRTVDIARKNGAKIFHRALGNNFSEQRNFGIEKASGEWVLFIDADERVTPALWYEIMQYTNDSIAQFSGFYIKRTDLIWGKQLKYGETGNVNFLRLAKKDSGEWRGKVHEEWIVKGRKTQLDNPILHYPHPTVKEFLKEINYYTDLRSQELFERKLKVNILSIIIYPSGKFINNYFIKLGFLDGVGGLVFALLMSFHSFLVRGKLWSLWQK